MIGGREHNRVSVKAVKVLNEAVYDAFQFAEFLLITPQLRNRVKLVEEQDARSPRGKFEQSANVLRCAS